MSCRIHILPVTSQLSEEVIKSLSHFFICAMEIILTIRPSHKVFVRIRKIDIRKTLRTMVGTQ